MTKWLLSTLVLLALLLPPVLAQTEPDASSVLYITRYSLVNDKTDVYGLFDLGSKPSVRLISPSATGGRLQLVLHGKQYAGPANKPFALIASFEDVSGRVFSESQPYSFTPDTNNPGVFWFRDLEGIAGLYGSQAIAIPVPYGTTVINLRGDDLQTPESPNQLLGYVSHIILPEEPENKQ